jgi:small subunit ribosomal protein S4e
MAKKGERKSQKRLSADKRIKVKRKEFAWLLKSKPGPYKRDESIALGIVVRDLLGLAENLRETKIVLSGGKILVNGVVRRAPSFPVGLFDVIEAPEQKALYRLVFDEKGRFEPKPITGREKNLKLCRIVGKKTVKGNVIQLETNDGRAMRLKKSALKPGDSVLVSLPEQKVVKEIRLEKGSIVYVVGGEHSGEIARVKEVIPGTMKRPRLVSLQERESGFLTVAENVFVVGLKKPELDLEAAK